MKSTFLLVITLPVFVSLNAQWDAPFPHQEFLSVYNSAREKTLIDPIVANGIYYENPYYNAEGHPFLGDDGIYSGSVVFRGRLYMDVWLKYEIYRQELILFTGVDKTLESVILTKEFVTEFEFMDLQFKKLRFNDNREQYFQVVAESDKISCYYFWYKTRSETQNEKNLRIYKFSEQSHKAYLYVDGSFYKYKSNRSFLKILPVEIRPEIKDYLKSGRISVKRPDSCDFTKLIQYIEALMIQLSIE